MGIFIFPESVRADSMNTGVLLQCTGGWRRIGMEHRQTNFFRAVVILVVVNAMAVLYGGYTLWQYNREVMDTEEKLCQTQEELAQSVSQEVYDDTGLYNEAGFDAKLRERQSTGKTLQALLYITFKSPALGHDLKYINDHYGHIAGNQAVKDFAKRLQDVFSGERYLLCHLGGSGYYVFDADYAGETELKERTARLKVLWQDASWRFNDICIGQPALNVVGVEVQPGDDPEHLKKALKERSSIIRDKALFSYDFLTTATTAEK